MTVAEDVAAEARYLSGLLASLRGPVRLDCEHQFKVGHQLTWRCDYCQPLTPDERREAGREARF